jgi:hypothetical protein
MSEGIDIQLRSATHARAAVPRKWFSLSKAYPLEEQVSTGCEGHREGIYEPAMKEQPRTNKMFDRMDPSICPNAEYRREKEIFISSSKLTDV